MYIGAKHQRPILLAEEHPTAVSVPAAAREAPTLAEPPTAVAVSNAEDVRAAIGAGDWLHSNQEPLSQRLVRVLEAEGWTYFRWAEFEAVLFGPSVDLFSGGSLGEAEVVYRNHYQLNLCLLGSYSKLWFAQDVEGPLADFETSLG